jgi:hypothetical protein
MTIIAIDDLYASALQQKLFAHPPYITHLVRMSLF